MEKQGTVGRFRVDAMLHLGVISRQTEQQFPPFPTCQKQPRFSLLRVLLQHDRSERVKLVRVQHAVAIRVQVFPPNGRQMVH